MDGAAILNFPTMARSSVAVLDLAFATRLVHVAPANCDDDAIETAIREAGCTPVRQ
jgi:hypothetical protein